MDAEEAGSSTLPLPFLDGLGHFLLKNLALKLLESVMGLIVSFQNSYVEVLIPSNLQYDLMCK
jgi:hypothetical protein